MSWTKDTHDAWRLMVANAVKMGKTVVSVSPSRLADALEEIERLQAENKSAWELAENLVKELGRLKMESACPVCRGGKNLEGEDVCSECKGTGLASVAYDVCRTHWKLMREERDALKLQLQLDSDRNLCEAAIRGKGAAEHSLAEVLKERK